MPTNRVARLVLLASIAVGIVGFGVGFGWTMVRFPRFRDTQPAPTWLPWLTVVLCLGALVVGVTTIVVAKSIDPADPAGPIDPTAATDIATDIATDVATDDWAPSQAAVAMAVFSLFLVGLVVPAIAAVDSEARGDPLRLALLLPVALVVLRWWRRRSARRTRHRR